MLISIERGHSVHTGSWEFAIGTVSIVGDGGFELSLNLAMSSDKGSVLAIWIGHIYDVTSYFYNEGL